jgi:hypothetical protein
MLSRQNALVLALSGNLFVPALACGARAPLDEGTGGVEALTREAPVDAGEDVASHPRAPGSAAYGPIDAGGGCAAQFLACESDTACATVLNCVIARCVMSDGGSQIPCAMGCSGGNFQQLSSMLPLFGCLQGAGPGGGGFAGGQSSGGGLGGVGGLLGVFGGGG